MKTTPTLELLALPAWNSEPRSLDDWCEALATHGHPPSVSKDADETWLEIEGLNMRGYVSFEGASVEAINFELYDPDPEPATRFIDAAALALGWEVHPDEPEEDDLDED